MATVRIPLVNNAIMQTPEESPTSWIQIEQINIWSLKHVYEVHLAWYYLTQSCTRKKKKGNQDLKKCILFAYNNHDKLRMLILNPNQKDRYLFVFNITYKSIANGDEKASCTQLVWIKPMCVQFFNWIQYFSLEICQLYS